MNTVRARWLAGVVAGGLAATAWSSVAKGRPGGVGRGGQPQPPEIVIPQPPDWPALDLSAPPPADDIPGHIARFVSDEQSVRSFYDVPWSESRLDRLDVLYRHELDGLAGVAFERLPHDQKIDFVLLRNGLQARLNAGALERARIAEMTALLPFRGTILALEESRWKMETIDPRRAAATLAEIADQVAAVRKRVEAGRAGTAEPQADGPDAPIVVTPVLARRTASAVGAMRSALYTWFTYHDAYIPEFSWWARRPFDDANRALDEFERFLREDIAGIRGNPEDPLIGDPIGRDALVADLATELIAYSPEELIAIAEREFAWCEAEFRKAAADMGLGDDWRAAMERVKAASMPPGRQTDLVAGFGREAVTFLTDRDLITIPPLCDELWRLTMISPDDQRFWPFAIYNDQHMLVAYPTDAMPHADKVMSMRGNNEHFTRLVTPHELIPGHHLQLFVGERVRPHRRAFSTPFFVEGWALYWEMRLWDLGWARSPEDRVGMLFWRAHRCARIIVSLRFHLGDMNPDEMVTFLVDRVGHERFSASSEVRRYISGDYGPLYQVAYMIGGLQLRALRAEAATMPDRVFHDAVLACNAIPMELVRAQVLGLPIGPDHAASWRFAGDPARPSEHPPEQPGGAP